MIKHINVNGRNYENVPATTQALIELGMEENAAIEFLQTHNKNKAIENAGQRLKTEHAKALNLLTGEVTPENRDTWPEQREAAQAYNSGRATDDQKELLRDSLKQGETLKSLVANILGKVKINRKLTGLANGVLRRAEDALEKGVDPDEVLATAGKEMEEAKQVFFAAVEAMKAQA